MGCINILLKETSHESSNYFFRDNTIEINHHNYLLKQHDN